jgi:3-oxoacyl-[acyl-carrier-protein] synthase II
MLTPSTAAVFSGASGVAPVTASELAFLKSLKSCGHIDYSWAYGNLLGHSVEAHFPAGIALAALALRAGRVSLARVGENSISEDVSSVDRIVVTAVGHWRGEGLALLEPIL